MKRRTFLASLFALPAAIKAAMTPVHRVVITAQVTRYNLAPSPGGGCTLTRASLTPISPRDMVMLDEAHLLYNGPKWIQVKRTTHIPFPPGINSWGELMIHNARNKLARQLAMPAPNLP